jgi:peptidoglycan/LPS O-acetylase OafA/YrhL
VPSLLSVPLPFFGSLDASLFALLWCNFLVGAILSLNRKLPLMSPSLAIVAWSCLLASAVGTWYLPWGSLLTPYCLLAVGRYLPRSFRSIGRQHDFSYGLYLYSFPLTQAAVSAATFSHPFLLALASILLTLPFAVVSWFLFERPWVSRSPVADHSAVSTSVRRRKPAAEQKLRKCGESD